MNELHFKNERDRWGYEEATRDPIFLLQSKDLICRVPPHGYQQNDEGDWVIDDEDDQDSTHPLTMFYYEAHRMGLGEWEEVWHTESVWFSRAEAEQFAQRTRYRYQHGWRVWCTCAEGKLAAILKTAGEAEPTEWP